MSELVTTGRRSRRVEEQTENHLRRARLLAVLAGFLLCIPYHLATAQSARSVERVWIERSEALMEAAKGNADMAGFRRDVQAHREKLRELVAANKDAAPQKRQLHLSMVLINALLNSASECHAGGRVVCPAELMQQLQGQIKATYAQLNVIEGGTR